MTTDDEVDFSIERIRQAWAEQDFRHVTDVEATTKVGSAGRRDYTTGHSRDRDFRSHIAGRGQDVILTADAIGAFGWRIEDDHPHRIGGAAVEAGRVEIPC